MKTSTTKETLSDREVDALFEDSTEATSFDTSTNSQSKNESQDPETSDAMSISTPGGDKSPSADTVCAAATAKIFAKQPVDVIVAGNEAVGTLSKMSGEAQKTTGAASAPREHSRQGVSGGSVMRKRLAGDEGVEISKRPAFEDRKVVRLRISSLI